MTKNESRITCPLCGFQKSLKMPSDSCMIVYICTNCDTELKPKEGDCCIFCSYGTLACPSKQ